MSKKTHLEVVTRVQNYAIEHTEIADLIAMFLKMRTHTKASIKISVGAETEEGFVSYLTSNLRFPKIRFSLWENEPIILIQNHTETIASLNIVGCSILYSEKVGFDAVYHTEKQTYIFQIANGLCYKTVAFFENRIESATPEAK